jgi:thiol-disulfide isomerase/thioredoxin
MGILKKVFIAAAVICSSLAAHADSYAPQISIKQWVTDSQYTLSSLSGQPYLLEFWATWCTPCVQNLPKIEEIYENYSDKGLRIIGLSLDNDISKLKSFVKEKKMPYPVAVDAGTEKSFGVRGIPAAFLVDASGLVVWSGHPASASLDDAIENVMRDSPMPPLADIDFSDFKEIKQPVREGEEFGKTLLALKGYAARENPLKDKAQKIIDTIEARLGERMALADKLRSRKQHKAAFNVYMSIVKNYRGSEISRQAAEKIRQIMAESS